MEKHLTQRTTLDDLAEQWNLATISGEAAAKWRTLWAGVERVLAGGGELWESETDGFRSFAGVYGLAVVRDGVWVWEQQIGRS